jgi:hypothetical protein
MMKDIHPDLGPRKRVSSIEDALANVRKVWPSAWMEGSTGFQRSFWIRGADGLGALVGHCWEIRGRSDQFWLRIKAGQNSRPLA